MMLADFLSEHGINTYCTGGKVVEYPGILGGTYMLESLTKFNIDIAFFSLTAFNSKGQILTLDERGTLNHTTFRKHSDKLVYFCGSDKFDTEGNFASLTLNDIDYFISDKKLPENVEQFFESTTFLCTN